MSCTTHHFACDCREAEMAKERELLLKVVEAARKWEHQYFGPHADIFGPAHEVRNALAAYDEFKGKE